MSLSVFCLMCFSAGSRALMSKKMKRVRTLRITISSAKVLLFSDIRKSFSKKIRKKKKVLSADYKTKKTSPKARFYLPCTMYHVLFTRYHVPFILLPRSRHLRRRRTCRSCCRRGWLRRKDHPHRRRDRCWDWHWGWRHWQRWRRCTSPGWQPGRRS